MDAIPVARTLEGSTLELAAGGSRLVVHTGDRDVWVVLRRSTVGMADADALGAALRAEAPASAELLLWDTTPGDPLDKLARAGGWTLRATKVFVERDLSKLPDPDKTATGWTRESFADLGLDAFARAMLAAGEGDAFSTTTPETAADDVTDLVEFARDAFDPARWFLISDAAGPVGVVLPQHYPDEPGTGSIFYIGIMPHRRGAGHGTRLHLLGLHELADGGCTRYVGSTDQRNPAMVRIFERNGARATGTQSFYAPA